jgi:hypothetical protein
MNQLSTMTKAAKKVSEGKEVVAVSAAATHVKKGFPTMSHLFLKRFSDSDPTLTPGAKRNRADNPHVAIAELDPSGRAGCKLCGEKIRKDTVRMKFMLECHKGYRIPCTLHSDCFVRHPETVKLHDIKEIHIDSNLSKEQGYDIIEKFEKFKTMTKVAEDITT